MSLACSRSLFFTAFTAGALALGASYYLEYAVGLTPCSLCLAQRFFMALLMACCGLAAIHGPRRVGLSLYWATGLGLSLGGTTAAWRQVLLQSDPLVQMTRCAPDSEALFSTAVVVCNGADVQGGCRLRGNFLDAVGFEHPGMESAVLCGDVDPCGVPIAASGLERSATTAQRRSVAPGAGRGLNTCMNFISCVP